MTLLFIYIPHSTIFIYSNEIIGLMTAQLGILLPLETIKRRMYLQINSVHSKAKFHTIVQVSKVKYASAWNCGLRIMTEEGGVVPGRSSQSAFSGLYRGFKSRWYDFISLSMSLSMSFIIC